MPYYTSEIATENQINFIQILDSNWSNQEESNIVQEFIKKLFPKSYVPDLYDVHFYFPRGSYVCIRQDTPLRYIVDVYSKYIEDCMSDFLSTLERIRELNIGYILCNHRLEYEVLCIQDAIVKSIIRGRGFIYIFPIPIKFIIEKMYFSSQISINLQDIIVSIITFIIYTSLYVRYELSRRKKE